MAETHELSGHSGLEVSLLTPRGPLANERADAVTAPGELGEFAVLPGHVAFLTALHPGVLALTTAGKQQIFAVGPGYVRVSAGGALEVLVEEAVRGEDVDIDAARADLEATTREVDDWNGAEDAEYKNLRARYEWARARVDAHGRATAA